MSSNKTEILDKVKIEQKINRIAHQIFENNYNKDHLIIVGIVPRGILLTQRLVSILEEISPLKITTGELTINNDLAPNDMVSSSLPVENYKDQTVILVDDVLNTGKTLIHAAQFLITASVKSMSTVTLVDRRHRLFPIKADYVGMTLSTTIEEHIFVELEEGNEVVYLS